MNEKQKKIAHRAWRLLELLVILGTFPALLLLDIAATGGAAIVLSIQGNDNQTALAQFGPLLHNSLQVCPTWVAPALLYGVQFAVFWSLCALVYLIGRVALLSRIEEMKPS